MPLEIFRQITAIPRPSGQEAQLRDWLRARAERQGASAEVDAAGNLLLRVPARGRQRAAPVVLQGHMDMVCEKRPDSSHDFTRDPLRLIEDGEWLRADGTTLGADNGVALAMALALLEDAEAIYPELELLFTSDEETGLTGAQQLGSGWLRGDTLLNLDSEEEGVFMVGCAGGRESWIELPVELVEAGAGRPWQLRVAELPGGHSGIDIHRSRPNAIKVLAGLLDQLGDRVRLHALSGGTAHNAIPRDAGAAVMIRSEALAGVHEVIRVHQGRLGEGGRIELRELDQPVPERVLGLADQRRLLDLLLALPHGVAGMLEALPQIVETSANLARVELAGVRAKILTSQRSSQMQRLRDHARSVEAIAALAGASCGGGNEYAAWQPLAESRLADTCCRLYREQAGAEPRVEVIHAGLECGVIAQHYPGLEMISFGPTIHDAHSPDERLHLPSLERVYGFLKAALREV